MEAILLSIFLGFSVAILGAWKDTQWEPFSVKTFLRSPVLSILWAVILVSIFKNNNPLLIALSAISMERLTVESWKGLIRKMPSKFNNEERDTQWVKRRISKN
jgi:hypothetical protein